jgi:parvulin-like peptidyl-prolyl isomerase
VKSKRNSNIKDIKLALVTLIGAMLINIHAIAADTAKEITSPSAQDSSNKKVITEGQTAPDSTPKRAGRSPYFAKVGDMLITWVDYNNMYATQASEKFYHAKPSESSVAAFQREIADTLVTNAMLVQEAKRRKLKPDEELIKQQLRQFEQRFANDPNWTESRPRVLPIIAERYQNENLRSKLEDLVRNVPPPSEKQLRKYYAAHPEKFTMPAQQRVSTILLRMDPGAPDADWQKAMEQGEDLVRRLRAGEDFAELARNYSGDVTAEDGGDMGYLHEGILPGLPAETLRKLKPGETSNPVTLMEGVAIFRLTERQPPKLSSFKEVQARAKELWLIEQRDSAWDSLIARLKKNTTVQVDESRFLPLPDSAKKQGKSMEATKP